MAELVLKNLYEKTFRGAKEAPSKLSTILAEFINVRRLSAESASEGALTGRLCYFTAMRLFAFLLLLPALSFAQIPHTFNNGQVADADKINENFRI